MWKTESKFDSQQTKWKTESKADLSIQIIRRNLQNLLLLNSTQPDLLLLCALLLMLTLQLPIQTMWLVVWISPKLLLRGKNHEVKPHSHYFWPWQLMEDGRESPRDSLRDWINYLLLWTFFVWKYWRALDPKCPFDLFVWQLPNCRCVNMLILAHMILTFKI